MTSQRDLFANFDRMRREMDELFGDVFERRTGLRGRGFSPTVDVYYTDNPPRAVVKVDLAAVDPADVALEIRGRQLLIAGERRPAETGGRLYQQIEIEHGPFKRVVELGADVVAGQGQRLLHGRRAPGRDSAGRPGSVRAARADLGLMTIHIPSVNGEPAEIDVQSALPDALPVLPLRDSVAFPDTMMPLAVGQERSIKLVNDVLGGNRMLVMVAAKDPDTEEPGPDDLYRVGVVGVVARMLKVPDGTVRILVQCGQRVELGEFVATEPYLVARITEAPDEVVPSPELEALVRNVQTTFSRIIEELPYLPEELQMAVANVDDPAELAHMIAGSLRVKTEEKQQLLEERDVTKRLRHALRDPRPRARAGRDRHPHPVAGAVRDGPRPARVLAAPAAQGDPGGARRGRRAGGGGPGAARAARGGRSCPSTPGRWPSGSCGASSASRRSPSSTA